MRQCKSVDNVRNLSHGTGMIIIGVLVYNLCTRLVPSVKNTKETVVVPYNIARREEGCGVLVFTHAIRPPTQATGPGLPWVCSP